MWKIGELYEYGDYNIVTKEFSCKQNIWTQS